MAVKKMTKAWYKVIFDEEGSGALNKITKEWIPMEEKDEAYFLQMWVKTAGSDEGFQRQE